MDIPLILLNSLLKFACSWSTSAEISRPKIVILLTIEKPVTLISFSKLSETLIGKIFVFSTFIFNPDNLLKLSKMFLQFIIFSDSPSTKMETSSAKELSAREFSLVKTGCEMLGSRRSRHKSGSKQIMKRRPDGASP